MIGVVKSIGELQTFKAKNTGRELKKKELMLVDQSQKAVSYSISVYLVIGILLSFSIFNFEIFLRLL